MTSQRMLFDLRRMWVAVRKKPSPAIPRERANDANYLTLLWNRLRSERNTEGFMELVRGVLPGKMPMM